MRQEIRDMLTQYAEQQYKDFSSSLIPGAKPLLGVRLPQLRQLAKSIANDKTDKSRWRQETAAYDGDWEDLFFEETMLRGMLISYGTAQKEISSKEGLLYL